MQCLLLSAWLLAAVAGAQAPRAVIHDERVIFIGLERNNVEVFLNIPYGDDTSGPNRFKAPRLRTLAPGTIWDASHYGPACPQPLGGWFFPLSLTNVTEVSEDCLNLNMARPNGTDKHHRLPVMVHVNGISFWEGQSKEITISPDGLVLESVKNGLPVIHVAMNYRLGVFGFAQSHALKLEGSENAGLRDQRLALEWVSRNIRHFGGDPSRVTVFGQSSGGLAVGMQIMAFGAAKPVPFHQAICESEALEPGITGNFSINAMHDIVSHVRCGAEGLHSNKTIECLRSLDMTTLLNASIATYKNDVAHNLGDVWLPAVDGDFLPEAPSALIQKKHLANVTTIMGWCEDDLTYFTDRNIKTSNDSYNFLSSYGPGLAASDVTKILSLYPTSDFPAKPSVGLSSEFFRTARVVRDILMICPTIWYTEHLGASGNRGFLYDWNQTILEPILAQAANQSEFGPIHTSELAYIFGNLSHYDVEGYPFKPTSSDNDLAVRGSRSWSTFASTGKLSLRGHNTFRDFRESFLTANETFLFVAGGPFEGPSALEGPRAHPAISEQKLTERCAYFQSPDIIEKLGY